MIESNIVCGLVALKRLPYRVVISVGFLKQHRLAFVIMALSFLNVSNLKSVNFHDI